MGGAGTVEWIDVLSAQQAMGGAGMVEWIDVLSAQQAMGGAGMMEWIDVLSAQQAMGGAGMVGLTDLSSVSLHLQCNQANNAVVTAQQPEVSAVQFAVCQNRHQLILLNPLKLI
jgi:hypothetical protein